MSALSDQISRSDLAGRVFNERQLQERLGGSRARRYGLVNRALKDGSLLQLKRGLYMLQDNRHGQAIHPFAVAQALMPGSYVSFESALSHHGWIPEAVYTTASATPYRKTVQYEAQGLGTLSFHPLAIHEYQFLTGVAYCKVGERAALVASPLRALMDLVALRRQAWTGMQWVTESLRIDTETLLTLGRADFDLLRPVYKHYAASAFLRDLESSVDALKALASKENR
jgi:hypothetical protein